MLSCDAFNVHLDHHQHKVPELVRAIKQDILLISDDLQEAKDLIKSLDQLT